MNKERKKHIKKLEDFLIEAYPDTQAFDCPDIMGDYKVTAYEDEEYKIRVLYAPYYEYVEIYGLTDEEFKAITVNRHGSHFTKKQRKK